MHDIGGGLNDYSIDQNKADIVALKDITCETMALKVMTYLGMFFK